MAKKKKAKRGDNGKSGTRATAGVSTWQDDPMGLGTIPRPVPKLSAPPLRLKFKGTAVPSGVYNPGTAEFRYWTAAEALRRGADYWAARGIKKWQQDIGATLPVGLDEGEDLNAYYDRSELAFFHGAAGGQTVYSGESPDVSCHELGHACLDAWRPQLWDGHYIEVGSFHESFGDMSAVLSALQLPTVRTVALPGIKANKASTISRCAEQLGWAIRQTNPKDVDPDCLRNAWNAFEYVDPNTLPDDAPASKLSAEVHSFSRVFTGAFYEILSKMLALVAKSPKEDDLITVAKDYGKLLLLAIKVAPVKPNYYAQVAARMIDVDTASFQGKYRSALTTTFEKRKLLGAGIVNRAVSVRTAARSGAAKTLHSILESGAPTLDTERLAISGKSVGLGTKKILVDAVVEHGHSLSAAGAQSRSMETRPADVETAVERFVEMLAAHGRLAGVETKRRGIARGRGASEKLPTHELVKQKDGLLLKRTRFLCGAAGGQK